MGDDDPEKKRRKVNNNNIISSNNSNIPNNESPFASPNRFTPLENMETHQIESNSTNTREPKPPPIFINNLTNINSLINHLKTLCKAAFKHITVDGKLKVTLETIDDYRKTVAYLQTTEAQFHTFQMKTDRNFRVVIRGLHPTCDVEALKNEIAELGYKPVQMIPIHHPITKIALPLFFLDLAPDPINSNIYSLSSLYYCKVKVEPPKPRRTIIQCLKCQSYGHSKNYCSNQPKCVKCDKHHPSDKCDKPLHVPPICVNCKGPHTANYKGCPMHKQLQMNHSKWKTNLQSPQQATNSQLKQANQDRDDSPNLSHKATQQIRYQRIPQQTYAEVTSGSLTETLCQKIDKLLTIISPLIEMLSHVLPALLKNLK